MEYINQAHREHHAVLETAVATLDRYEGQRHLAGGPIAQGDEYDSVREAIAWYDDMILHLSEMSPNAAAISANKTAIRELRDRLDDPAKGVAAEIAALKKRLVAAEASIKRMQNAFKTMAGAAGSNS